MQLYAVNFIPLRSSLYMFRAAHTPIIRSTSGTSSRDNLHQPMIVPVAVDTVELRAPDDGHVCRPKHVEWTKQRNKIHCIQLHLLVISNRTLLYNCDTGHILKNVT